MIIRGKLPDKNYTVIENAILRDESLSYRARGVLASILSRPENWTTSVKGLMGPGTEGRDAIETAVKELQAAGYMVLSKHQNERGLWSSQWTVYDSPQPVPENPVPVNRSLENRSLENRVSDNQGLKQVLEKKTVEEEVVANAPIVGETAAAFNEFWSLYPRKAGKLQAVKAFEKAAASVGTETIISGLKRLLPSLKASDPKYVKHPATWLNGGY